MIDERRVHSMRDSAQHDAQVFDLFAKRGDAFGRVRIRAPVRPFVELMDEHGDALERVIVHFACDPGAFFFVCREEVVSERAMCAQESPLVHDERGGELIQDDHERERDHYEKPPERACGGRGHTIPRAIRTYATMSAQLLTT